MTTDREINELALKVFEKRRDRALAYSLAQCEKYLRQSNQEQSRLWFRIGESLARLEERRDRAMRLTESLAAALSKAVSQGAAKNDTERAEVLKFFRTGGDERASDPQ